MNYLKKNIHLTQWIHTIKYIVKFAFWQLVDVVHMHWLQFVIFHLENEYSYISQAASSNHKQLKNNIYELEAVKFIFCNFYWYYVNK